jgi:regulator of replication initiation timing
MDNQNTIKELEILKEDNAKLIKENAKLKEELQYTKSHLKKYTAPASSKTYYDKNKEVILQKHKDPDYQTRRKEYNRKSYLKKKSILENNNIENI